MAEKNADPNADIAAMSFEQALKELEGIVSQLEQGQTTLEDSIGKYERGTALRKHCEDKLKEAEAKIERITGTGPDGPKTAPLDPS